MVQADYWHGKTILITGASSGLGWALVEALAPYNVHFGLLSRRTEKMQELADKLQASGSRFWIRACDVQDREQVLASVREFAREAGRIDVAWINSGVGGSSSFAGWNWDTVEALLDTNLKGAIYTTYACLETMSQQPGGALVAIGSVASMRGLPFRGIYSLTKMALEYFFESMAPEFPHLQFSVIHPGFVDTPINRGNPNRFWLMTPDQAAPLMLRAVEKRKRRYIYPWQMRLLYHLLRNLPPSLYYLLSRRLGKLSRREG